MHLAPFKLRQYGRNGCSHLTAEIERAIAFWLHVLPRGPFRAVHPHSGTPFVITMSDGEGTGSDAAAIWSPLAPGGVHQPRWFQLDLPPAALHAWSEVKELESQRHINKIEAIVPAICLCTWSHLIRGSLWLHFIDNDVALACLVSGCSKSSSLSAVVDYTWAQIPVLGCWPWFERVPSKCNIVDGLSRKKFSTALVNDWVRDSAQLPRQAKRRTHTHKPKMQKHAKNEHTHKNTTKERGAFFSVVVSGLRVCSCFLFLVCFFFNQIFNHFLRSLSSITLSITFHPSHFSITFFRSQK